MLDITLCNLVAESFLVVSDRLDLVRLGGSQHASLDGLFDEGNLPTRVVIHRPCRGLVLGT